MQRHSADNKLKPRPRPSIGLGIEFEPETETETATRITNNCPRMAFVVEAAPEIQPTTRLKPISTLRRKLKLRMEVRLIIKLMSTCLKIKVESQLKLN